MAGLDRALSASRDGGGYSDGGDGFHSGRRDHRGGGRRGRGGRRRRYDNGGHEQDMYAYNPEAGLLLEPEPGVVKCCELMGAYLKWDESAWSSPTAGDLVVQFEAKAKDNIVVAMSPEATQVFPMYEIIVGGWKDSKSAIRRGAQDAERALSVKPRLCSEAEYLPYWAMLCKGVVSVGVGNEPGKGLILAWRDPEPINARFVSFTTWDNTTFYRNIRVSQVQSGMEMDDGFDEDNFVPEYMRKLEEERKRRRERAERFDQVYTEPSMESLAREVLTPQELAEMKANSRDPLTSSAGTGFVTGFDPESAEEKEKAKLRAERFAVPGAKEELENLMSKDREIREARAKRFEIPVIEDLEMIKGVVRDLSGLRVPRRDPEDDEQLRPEAIHIYGSFDNVYSSDIMQWFGEYGASRIEWLHDCGANIVFNDEITAKRAMRGLSRDLPHVEEFAEQIDELRSKNYYTAPFPLRDDAGMRFFLIRVAGVSDVKADKLSGYCTNIGYSRRGRGGRRGGPRRSLPPRPPSTEEAPNITGRRRARSEAEMDDDGDDDDDDDFKRRRH